MTKRINFCFRTSFAGCDVPKKVEMASAKIAKRYHMCHEFTSDKSVNFSMLEDSFQDMLREHKVAGLDYLIEVEGIDYNVSR